MRLYRVGHNLTFENLEEDLAELFDSHDDRIDAAMYARGIRHRAMHRSRGEPERVGSVFWSGSYLIRPIDPLPMAKNDARHGPPKVAGERFVCSDGYVILSEPYKIRDALGSRT